MRRLDLDAAKTKLKRAKSEKGRSDVSIPQCIILGFPGILIITATWYVTSMTEYFWEFLPRLASWESS